MYQILNTRPINTLGDLAFHLPVIAIQSVPFDPIKINDFDFCIFLSVNAVDHFFAENKGLPKQAIAIGEATKAALISHGCHSIMMPSQFNSEGVLELPELQCVQHQSIAIISGENPRPLLTEKLIARGANIKSVFCYERVPVLYDMDVVFPELVKNDIQTVICASCESLDCLLALFDQPARRQWLVSKKIQVIGDRMEMAAKRAGFGDIVVGG